MNSTDWPTETSTDQTPREGQFDFAQAILHRKWLIILFVVIGMCGGYLRYTKSPPEYASFARLHVWQVRPPLVVDRMGEYILNDPLDTDAVLIRSPNIVGAAVEDETYNLQQLPSLKGRDAVSAVISGLQVKRSEDADEILDLSFTSSVQADCPRILSAVIDAYTQNVKQRQKTWGAEEVSQFKSYSDKVSADLEADELAYSDFRKKENSLLWMADGGRNIHRERLAGIENERSLLLIQRSDTQSKLEAIQTAIANGADHEALLLMIDQLNAADSKTKRDDGGPATIAGQLLPLMLEEQVLQEKVGASHPQVREVRKRIEMTRSFLLNAGAAVDGVTGRPDLLTIYLEGLRQELGVQDGRLVGLNALFTQESDAAREIAIEENEDRALREKIDRTKRLYDSILDQLQASTLTAEVGALRAEIVNPPGIGGQVAPVLSTSLGMGGIVGLMVGMAIAMLLELSDKGYRGPDDITRQLGVSVVGHIPNIDVARERKHIGASRIHPTLTAFHRPGSQLSESYRSVRTALLVNARDGRHQVIQVTSPNPGDGKSTLVANLAISIAKAGKTCLLVDADLRRPNVHKLFGMDNEVGLTSAIGSDMDFTEAIQPGPLPLLDVITAGPKGHNRSELLLSPRFSEMLEAVRLKYDFVLIDTPPVLAVSDPAAVAAMVDGVLLVLRMNKRSRLHAIRARETLDVVGARLMGVVVNGLGDAAAVSGFGTGARGYRVATYRELASGYVDSYGYDYRRPYSGYYQETLESGAETEHEPARAADE